MNHFFKFITHVAVIAIFIMPNAAQADKTKGVNSQPFELQIESFDNFYLVPYSIALWKKIPRLKELQLTMLQEVVKSSFDGATIRTLGAIMLEMLSSWEDKSNPFGSWLVLQNTKEGYKAIGIIGFGNGERQGFSVKGGVKPREKDEIQLFFKLYTDDITKRCLVDFALGWAFQQNKQLDRIDSGLYLKQKTMKKAAFMKAYGFDLIAEYDFKKAMVVRKELTCLKYRASSAPL